MDPWRATGVDRSSSLGTGQSCRGSEECMGAGGSSRLAGALVAEELGWESGGDGGAGFCEGGSVIPCFLGGEGA